MQSLQFPSRSQLLAQMKTQELARGETAAVMGLCDISALRILARRLAPDAAAAEADRWRPSSPGVAPSAAPQRSTGKAAAGFKTSTGATATEGARPGAPYPEQYQPPPPPGVPSQLPGDFAQPPAPLLQELDPPKVLVRCRKHRTAPMAACQTAVRSALLTWLPKQLSKSATG